MIGWDVPRIAPCTLTVVFNRIYSSGNLQAQSGQSPVICWMLRAAEASLLSPDHAPPSAGTAGQASAAVNQAAVVKEKLRQKMKQQAMQSLEMPAPKIASEFYTEAEMASFKKVKKRSVLRPLKSNRRAVFPCLSLQFTMLVLNEESMSVI